MKSIVKRLAGLKVLLALLTVALGCTAVCTYPELEAASHGELAPPAGKLVLRCGDKTWSVKVKWAPKACLDRFARCMTPPPGWAPGSPEPSGWKPPECAP